MEDPVCASCECPPFTHTYFHDCELFDKKPVCIDCCRDTPVAEFLDSIKKHATKELVEEDIKTICKNAAHL